MNIKQFVVLAIFALTCLGSLAQSDSTASDSSLNEVMEVFEVDQKASFPGGEKAFNEYVNDYLKIPEIAYDGGTSGTVIVTFTVEKDGSITGVRIASKKRIGFGVEKECIRVIKRMPKWNPAIYRDRPVRMRFTKPFRFIFE